jgi:putative hemolysin
MENTGAVIDLAFIVTCIIVVFFMGIFLSFLKNALACCRRARLRLLAETGEKKYITALELDENPRIYQASLRAGIIFLEIVLGFLGGMLIYRLLRENINLHIVAGIPLFILASLVFSVIFFILAEIILREIARAAPEKITATFSGFIKIFSVLTSPLYALDLSVAALLRKILHSDDSSSGMTEDELHIALLEGEKSGIVESNERSMVEGVFYLGDRPVGTFMTHRSEIVWLELEADSQKSREAVKEAGAQHYLPVVEGDLDKVTGIVSTEDILMTLLSDSWPGLKSLMHPPFFVPETMPALKAFEAFKKSQINCLLVMDEYGGFAGILTVHNLIEEIVGQLSDSEGSEESIVKQEDGTWLMDGSLNIDEAGKVLSLSSLDEEESHSEYHTLAGFILNLAGEIPKTGAYFDYNGFRFTVVDMDGNRIDKVMVKKIEKQMS